MTAVNRLGNFEAALNQTVTVEHTVTEKDTAMRWGNDLPVLSTPVLLWLSELAAMRAVEPYVVPGWMTVGIAHDSSHLAPSVEGNTISINATLVDVDGSRLRFDVSAEDGETVILAGSHTRGVINSERFRQRLILR
ncbi:thioesterase family protein [Nocardia terpenica]|uniref:Fluoroacetyl-CoA-specific thioesterase-like domain-containing protein n=1 Tax=Nocardia terpenica TaxID=455432 RepID=A0A164KQS3_9NOCA|nr:hypothetical protein [Nocardia terpenica]KZM71637.1 hypothetical protein AWN90_02620 [Nocardia terpenica]NQE90856.1 hypothetical protein [Nocardia terpenica]